MWAWESPAPASSVFKSKDIGFQSENASRTKKNPVYHDCSLLRETVGTLLLCLNRIKLPLEANSKQENKIRPRNVQNCPLSPCRMYHLILVSPESPGGEVMLCYMYILSFLCMEGLFFLE